MEDPTKTTYGTISASAAPELRTFAFLIGTWEGHGGMRMPDGSIGRHPVKWIGRYILDGQAIADELHGDGPDGKAHMGITFRQYDAARHAWVIEFLNVTGSFLRRQVGAGRGSVEVKGDTVTVHSAAPGMRIREHYIVPDNNHFTYRMDTSTDEGASWSEGQVEMRFARVQ